MWSLYCNPNSLCSAAAQIWRYCSLDFSLLHLSLLFTPTFLLRGRPGRGHWNNWTPGPLWESPSGPEHSPHKQPASPGAGNLTPCRKSSKTSRTGCLLCKASRWVCHPFALRKIPSHKESNTSSMLRPSSGDPHLLALHPNQRDP